jgi:hypothetical protein
MFGAGASDGNAKSEQIYKASHAIAIADMLHPDNVIVLTQPLLKR